MLHRLSHFGGFITLGGKKLSVRGRTIEMFAEFEGYWLSICGNPLAAFERLLMFSPSLRTLDLCAAVLRKIRVLWVSTNEEDKDKFARSAEGRIFILWQCISHNSPEITLDWVEDRIDEELDSENEHEFWADVENKIGVASGVSVISRMFDVHRPGTSIGRGHVVSVLSSVVEISRSKAGIPYSEIKKMTLEELRVLMSDKRDLVDSSRDERRVPEGDPIARMYAKNYRRLASELFGIEMDNTKRSTRAKDTTPKPAMPTAATSKPDAGADSERIVTTAPCPSANSEAHSTQ